MINKRYFLINDIWQKERRNIELKLCNWQNNKIHKLFKPENYEAFNINQLNNKRLKVIIYRLKG